MKTASASSLTYVPLVPSAAGMERWEIDSGCRMCRLCVKKGPGGAVEYMETLEPGLNKDEWRAVAVYVEYNGKAVHPVTFELIGKARELAAVTGHPVYALFMGVSGGRKGRGTAGIRGGPGLCV